MHVRSSCARAFMSSPAPPYLTVPGPRPFTKASVLATRPTTLPFAPSPTNGSASFMPAGNHEPHTTNLAISNPSKTAPLQTPNACEKTPAFPPCKPPQTLCGAPAAATSPCRAFMNKPQPLFPANYPTSLLLNLTHTTYATEHNTIRAAQRSSPKP